jgi:hypothetical protein
MSLQTMTVSKLKGLRREVEAAIRAKVTERRHEIETELSKLSQFGAIKPAKVVRARARGMVAVKVGNELDESLGADSPKTLTPKQPKQLKRTGKVSKPCMGLLKSSTYFTPFSTSFIPVSLFDLESRFFAPTRTC